jgi:polyhydroxyalkanoate synthesis regulator phasin
MEKRLKKIFLPTTLNTQWSNNMSKLSQLKKVLIVFLAGFVLLISTACSSTNSPQASRENVNPRTNVQKLTEQPDYDYYDANQPKRGGMNKYNDDPRLENPRLQKRVDKLVKGAKANIEEQKEERNNFSEKYSDDKTSKTGQALGNIKEDVGQRIEDFKQDISQGTQQQMDKTKNNLEKTNRNIRRTAENTDKNTADRRNAKDTLDRIGEPS